MEFFPSLFDCVKMWETTLSWHSVISPQLSWWCNLGNGDMENQPSFEIHSGIVAGLNELHKTLTSSNRQWIPCRSKFWGHIWLHTLQVRQEKEAPARKKPPHSYNLRTRSRTHALTCSLKSRCTWAKRQRKLRQRQTWAMRHACVC